MKTVYVLSNLGTPSAPTDEAVADFLREFLYDPAVIPLPAVLRYPLVHWVIAGRRSKKSAEKYRAIWMTAGSPDPHGSVRAPRSGSSDPHGSVSAPRSGSPLMVWSLALQEAVQAHLPCPVLLGMRYGQPSLREAAREAKALGAARVVLVPLYPQFAEATNGSTIAHFREVAAAAGFTGKVQVFPAFPRAPFFTKPLAETIRPYLQPDSHLLLSFHGLPVKQLSSRHCGEKECCERSLSENVSCYRAHCLATAQETARLLGLPPERWTMGFQSRFGRAKWIGPHTEELMQSLPREGKTNLVVAAPSFVADCLETSEELGIQNRDAFLRAGGKRFELVPCLNGDPAFARGLAEALKGV